MTEPIATGTAASLREHTASGRTTTAATVDSALVRAREVDGGKDGLNIFVSLDESYLRRACDGVLYAAHRHRPGSARSAFRWRSRTTSPRLHIRRRADRASSPAT